MEDRRLLAVVFDNGPTDPDSPTWSATHPGYAAFDDFKISETTTLQAIQYDAFHNRDSDYRRTRVQIVDGIGGAPVVPDLIATAELTRNGLTSSNSLARRGYTHRIDGLSISLEPGRYYLGISLENVANAVATVGSGSGSDQTLGQGLYQRFPHESWILRAGDHLSFQLIAPDEPPVAADDEVHTTEDVAVTVPATANDLEGSAVDPATTVVTASPENGSLLNHGDGTFTYHPAADFHGSDQFTYEVAAANGLTDTATVSIEVAPVNDPPSFAAGPDQLVTGATGPHGVEFWASQIRPGPENESHQHVSFAVTADDDRLFAEPPTISPDGTLRYAPASGASGTAIVSVRAVDDGGTEAGGRDTSSAQTFAITFQLKIEATIDVESDQINLQSQGRVPVAILSTQRSAGELETLDATLTDLSTLRVNGVAVDPVHAVFEDVDGDGDDDLVVHFRVPELFEHGALDPESVDFALSAQLADGTEWRGIDEVSTKLPPGHHGPGDGNSNGNGNGNGPGNGKGNGRGRR